METPQIRQFLCNLPKEAFEHNFAYLIQDETFSAVASGVGSEAESYFIGTKLQQAGLTALNPSDQHSVLSAARAVTSRAYEIYYHP